MTILKNRILLVLALMFVAYAPMAAQNTDDIDQLVDTLDASTITSTKDHFENTTQTGLTKLDGSKFQKGFALFNSPDVIKTLQMLPGVAFGTELLSGFYVRGGTGYDNLFLLDGVPMYQVSHLGGLFSSFNADIVENTDFYKSGFPARYGGRLSSVVDVSTKAGDFYKYHGSFSIGLMDGRLQFEGPIVPGSTSFNLSLRRSWIDIPATPVLMYVNRWMAKEGDNQKISAGYNFGDFNAGITHKFSDYNTLSLNFYTGQDLFRLNVEDWEYDWPDNPDYDPTYKNTMNIGGTIKWGNLLASLVWKNSFSKRLFGRNMIYFTRYNSSIGIGFSDEYIRHKEVVDYEGTDATNAVHIGDLAAQSDWSWILSDAHHLRFGANVKAKQYHHLNEIHTEMKDFIDTTITAKNHYDAGEMSLYAEDEMSIGQRTRVNVGLRYMGFMSKGRLWNMLDPRVSVKYQLGDNTSLRASYSVMNQYDHQVATTYIDLPTNLWMPSTDLIGPMKSRQAALGVYSSAVGGRLKWSIEGYYKSMHNLREYNGTANIFPPINKWESDFIDGKGIAYGSEFSVEYDPNPNTNLTAYYTLAWSRRYFEEFYYDWYPDRCDNRHKITLMANHKFNDHIDGYIGWNYNSGNWFTLANQKIFDSIEHYGVGTEWQSDYVYVDEVYARPNNIRMPAYHRMDLGVNFRKVKKNGHERIWNFSVYNVYCRMNAIMATIEQEWDNYVDEDGVWHNDISGYYTQALGVIPIIPTFSYGIKF
ncbi:MAG: TonB-dependent receptor [Bacteroidales bacterium]|nr:TonB-dependent receptor [Candidatus Equibacterium intestinale]